MSTGNPLIDQGTLNRVRGSVVWPGFPALNVTAAFLGKEALTLSLEGDSTDFIETQTGAVTSPKPYMPITIQMNLLRTQPLADQYKRQMEADSRLGSGTVRTDSSVLSTYDIVNCAIQNVAPLKINGEDAGFVVTIKGYYNINSNLWNL